MTDAVFWVLAGLVTISALMVVVQKNPINAALWLIAALFFTAGLYVTLHAGFVAVAQVLVYAGAIMVLFVFTIMLLNLREEQWGFRRHRLIKGLGIGIVALLLVRLAGGLAAGPDPAAPALRDGFGSLEAVGLVILDRQMLPFEIASLLLLVAVVGAVLLAGRRT